MGGAYTGPIPASRNLEPLIGEKYPSARMLALDELFMPGSVVRGEEGARKIESELGKLKFYHRTTQEPAHTGCIEMCDANN
jgi:hypothetical protein